MLDFFSKEYIGIVCIILGVCSYIPYFIGIYKKTAKPHVFSWLIWGLVSGISAAAQYTEHAGPGMWPMGFTTLACLTVAALSLNYGEKTITRNDIIAFVIALSAIPLWYLTKNALSAVLLSALIDVMAFYPTFRKSWSKPHEEVLLTYFLCAIEFFLSFAALEKMSFITAFNPACLVILNGSFFVMALIRRKLLNQEKKYDA